MWLGGIERVSVCGIEATSNERATNVREKDLETKIERSLKSCRLLGGSVSLSLSLTIVLLLLARVIPQHVSGLTYIYLVSE